MTKKGYEDIEIPEQLSQAVGKGIEKGKKLQRAKRRRTFCSVAGSMAAVLALLFMFAYANPAMAAKIPIIGSLFESLQEKGEFPGDFSGRAVNLGDKIEEKLQGTDQKKEGDQTEEANIEDDKAKNTKEVTSGEEDKIQVQRELVDTYGDEDQGITVIPAEVYYDGASIYLTLKLLNGNEGGFGQLHVWENAYSQIQVMGRVEAVGYEAPFSTWLTGEQNGASEFNGRMKLAADNLSAGQAKVCITDIFWSDASTYVSDTGVNKHILLNGEWDLTVPLEIDDSRTYRYDIKAVNERGFGIDNIVVTPYEVRIADIVPPLSPELLEEVYINFQRLCEEKLGETGAAKFLANAWFDKDDVNWHGGFAVFDQDGEALEIGSDYTEGNVYQIGMKDIRTLSVYLMPDDITAMKCKDKGTAEKCNIFRYELEVGK